MRVATLGTTAVHPHPVPGQIDVGNHVTFLARLGRSAARPSSTSAIPSNPSNPALPADQAEPATAGSAARPASRRRALGLGALATSLLVLGGGSLAVASAHKTVTLDVDGRPVEVSTFAGSVDGLLTEHGVDVGTRDSVAPGVDEALRDGTDIVVRHAQQVTLLADGTESTVWTTALTADEALAGLAARGADVRLVASRSADTGRADLPVQLDLDGSVDVVVDGRTEHVEDASAGLEEVLAALDVTVGELDRVHVQRDPDSGALTVVVQRVVAHEQADITAVPFERSVEQTEDLYKGESEVAVAGAVGERTTVHRLILVDGVEESRMLLSDTVTRQPVTEVVREGIKARPAPRVVRTPAPVGGGPVVTGDVWAALAQCESGGNPSIVSASGKYHGLYQFSVSTWEAMGGTGLPSQASPAEQTQRAQALQARSGWGQWPACASKLGLL